MSVVGTVLSIFLLLFLGYGTKKIRLLRAEDADLLNTVVIYLTLPAFIFDAIYSYRQPLPLSIVKVPIIGFAMIAVVLAIAFIVGRMLRLDRPTLGGLILASGFGNTGFLGYPVVQAAFHERGALVTAALYDELAMALPMYTLGALIAAGLAGEKVEGEQLLRVFKLPAFLAIPVALLLRPVAIPEPLLAAIRYLGNGTIPLVMISLGLSLSARSLKGLAVPVLAVCVLKLGRPAASHALRAPVRRRHRRHAQSIRHRGGHAERRDDLRDSIAVRRERAVRCRRDLRLDPVEHRCYPCGLDYSRRPVRPEIEDRKTGVALIRCRCVSLTFCTRRLQRKSKVCQ